MADDMGYADLSCYGQKNYSTPNLDKLAAQGIKFINAYSASSLCTPTRTAFMTGRYPARTTVGLFEPLTASKDDLSVGLTPENPSVATRLKTAGYSTALIGKWHLGEQPQHSPNNNGFEYFFGFHSGAADYISHKNPNGESDLYENETPVSREGYLTDLFTEKAINFIHQQHKKPFFLALMYNAPHWPWQGPGDLPYADSTSFLSGGSPATYAEMIKRLDMSIGKIMSSLDESNLSEKTVVIFTNDNGGEKYSDQGGLANRKPTLWDGGIRVPAFVRWPKKIKPGTSTEQLTITMDWTATILSLGKVKADPGVSYDGIDLLPVLTGKHTPVERELYWRTGQRRKQKALRVGDWKFLQDEAGEYLFDLRHDPGERTNLKQSHPDLMDSMKKKYAEWEKKMLPPVSL